jgi:beta-lactamase regulating signal transducer with metallopeptidase domain
MQTLLEIGLANAVMATVLAFLAAGVSYCCRRPAVSHILWLLVLLRLVTPPLMPLPFGWPAVVETALPVPAALPSEIQPAEQALANETIMETIVDGASEEDANRLFFEILALYERAAEEAADKATAAEAVNAGATLRQSPKLSSWMTGAVVVWLAGAVLWFVVAGLRVYCFHRLLRYGKPAPKPLQAQAQLLAERLGLARCPTVWVIPGRISPLLWALGGRARLILPAPLLKHLGPEQQASLLAHELAHARRRDHWVRWLELIVTCLYWWHPVAWWARRELQQAEEQCCDAWVVWTLPAAAKAYAKALLQTVEFLDARPALPPAASGVGHVHLLKRRLTMIVNERLSPRLPWPVYLGTVLLGLLILPLAPQRSDAQDADGRLLTVAEGASQTQLVQDTKQQELERRLRVLEERLDKILQSLESRRGPTSETRGRADAEKAREKEVETAKRRIEMRERKLLDEKGAVERAREAEKAIKEGAEKDRAAAREAAAKARAAAREAEAQARESVAKLKDKLKENLKEGEKKKSKADEPLKFTFQFEIDGKGLTPERKKELEQKIQEAIRKAVDPERLKQLQMKIQSAIEKNFNPERMKNLQKELEALGTEGTKVLSERLKALSNRVEEEETMKKRAERSRSAEGRRPGAPGAGRGSGSTSTGTGRGSGGSSGREARDLEQRLERLEEKMDKVLKALETSRGPSR